MTGYYIFWAVNLVCLTVYLAYWGHRFDCGFRSRTTAIEAARVTDREQFEASQQSWNTENAKAQTDRESLLARIRELISADTANESTSEALSMPPNALGAATEVTPPHSPSFDRGIIDELGMVPILTLPRSPVFDVDFVEELRLRRWARENFVSVDERDDIWHPVVLEEMKRVDEEMKRADNNVVQAE